MKYLIIFILLVSFPNHKILGQNLSANHNLGEWNINSKEVIFEDNIYIQNSHFLNEDEEKSIKLIDGVYNYTFGNFKPSYKISFGDSNIFYYQYGFFKNASHNRNNTTLYQDLFLGNYGKWYLESDSIICIESPNNLTKKFLIRNHSTEKIQLIDINTEKSFLLKKNNKEIPDEEVEEIEQICYNEYSFESQHITNFTYCINNKFEGFINYEIGNKKSSIKVNCNEETFNELKTQVTYLNLDSLNGFFSESSSSVTSKIRVIYTDGTMKKIKFSAFPHECYYQLKFISYFYDLLDTPLPCTVLKSE